MANNLDEIHKSLTAVKTNNGIGIRQSSYATDYVYQGKGYSVAVRVTIAAATNMIIILDTTSMTRDLSVYTPTFDTTTGPLNIDYYIGADYVTNGATAVTPTNRAYYGPASECTVYYGALADFSGTSKGVKFSEGMAVAGHKEGGTAQEEIEFVPTPNQRILIEVDNTNGTDASVLVRALWFEV